ncbi:retrotransposon protein, putative, ty1-copia subclass [Tanacetum coccineum]
MIQDVKSWLGKCFAMKDLGEVAYILGIKIYRDRSRQLIALNQSAYIDKTLKRYRIDTSKRRTIPMQPNVDLSNTQGPSTSDEVKRMKGIPYALAVAISIHKFISGLGVVPSIERPMDMYCDNTCSITIADKPGVQRDNNLANPFTKLMPCTKHVEHARSIGLRPAGSFM